VIMQDRRSTGFDHSSKAGRGGSRGHDNGHRVASPKITRRLRRDGSAGALRTVRVPVLHPTDPSCVETLEVAASTRRRGSRQPRNAKDPHAVDAERRGLQARGPGWRAKARRRRPGVGSIPVPAQPGKRCVSILAMRKSGLEALRKRCVKVGVLAVVRPGRHERPWHGATGTTGDATTGPASPRRRTGTRSRSWTSTSSPPGKRKRSDTPGAPAARLQRQAAGQPAIPRNSGDAQGLLATVVDGFG
jgi:hypothetical protein